jgi:molybdopterin-guanine dinucleotide biosynthesis protein A
VATFSCDAPFFPPDLVARLAERLTPASGCSFASAQGIRHPVFALWRISALDRLQQAYATGMRSLMAAQDRIGGIATLFDKGEGPGGDVFFNINSPKDQALAQAWLAASQSAGWLETCLSNARHG